MVASRTPLSGELKKRDERCEDSRYHASAAGFYQKILSLLGEPLALVSYRVH